jgi:hypothetical protein
MPGLLLSTRRIAFVRLLLPPGVARGILPGGKEWLPCYQSPNPWRQETQRSSGKHYIPFEVEEAVWSTR